MTVTNLARSITGGVDTHLDVHVAAALDERGTLLGVESFATTENGYKKLLGWLSDFGPVELVGVEGTGSYGAGLTRHLHAERVRVVEVDRPNRQRRRLKGKSDPQDAISAARAALSGDAIGEAKTRDGNVESMRVLRVARSSARKGRTQALNQMRGLISTAPEPIRAELRGLNVLHLLERASTYRPGAKRDIVSLTKFTLRMLARRAITLEVEVSEIDALLKALVIETAPQLVGALGIGTDAASALLVTAGDNPERLRDEAAFAHLCGASPIEASSGKQERHRLNRSGDRQANSALWPS
jgi:transposase